MWFRIHTALLHNAKAQSLPGAMFKSWINLLCLAKEGDGVIPSVLQVAFHLRMKVLPAQQLMNELEQRGFVSVQPDGTFLANDWNEHQYKSDVSTDRVKRFRKQQGNVSGNVSETPRNVIETPSETETDTEAESTKTASRKSRSASLSIGTRIQVAEMPEEWADFSVAECGMTRERARQVFVEFRDYWISIPGAKGRKIDWLATWRNRCRDVKARDSPKPGAFNFQPRESPTEKSIRIGLERVLETGRL